jgi:DNA adenine methylase
MRYFGGKSKISKQLAEYINTYANMHNMYIEPFCGSCNVASKVNIENKILNDKHFYLIEMFKALQNGWLPPDAVGAEEYKLAKLNQDKNPHVAGFVGFSCSFAGKYWGGYARSNDRNYADESKKSILNKMKNLKNAQFTCKDFSELDYEDSLIYCDPPYLNTTQYYKKILGRFNYDEFLKWIKEQSKKNIVLISEYKHNLPKDAKLVFEIPSISGVRNKDGGCIKTTEILFTYNNI